MSEQQQKNDLVYGTVEEAFPNALFSVVLDDTNETINAKVAGKMRKFRIRVLVGDRVGVELDTYGGNSHRIKTRL